jgi:predicted PurR-regulated permease PerM
MYYSLILGKAMQSENKIGWRNTIFWGLFFLAVVGLLFLLSDIIMPFVAGIILAYLLGPAKRYMIKIRLGHGVSSLVLLLSFIAFVSAFIFLMVPIFVEQFQILSTRIPAYLKSLEGEAKLYLDAILQNFQNIDNTSIYSFVSRVFKNLFSVLNILSLVFITPIVTFYLLRDWENIITKVNRWIPRHIAPVIRRQFREIDKMLAAYIRGKITIGFFLAAYYGIGLAVIGLDYGFSIGIIAGFLSLIPYFGLIFGVFVSIGLAIIQFGDTLHILLVAGVFLTGQLCDDYWLTPKLIGQRTGLHPLWIIFALMAGASLFGFLGILLAIPVAAIIRVFSRYALKAYRTSMYFKGYRSKA